MIQGLAKLNEKWKTEGFDEVKVGIGLNTGEVIVGNMGSKDKFDYTVIGDAVNLASRLEGLNKVWSMTSSSQSFLQKPHMMASWKQGQIVI